MNKTIWMYWHQGFEKANTIIHECIRSWKFYNPDWQLILLDQHSVKEYTSPLDIPADKVELLCVQHRSDLIRTKLLIEYGGVWADPTCFCNKPLDTWIHAALPSGCFFFHKPARERLIGNWFIAAGEKNNLLLKRVYEALCLYWSRNDFRNFHKPYEIVEDNLERFVNRSPFWTRLWLTPLFTKVLRLYPYMIYHYVFNKLVTSDADCIRIWNDMPKYSALEPPVLQRIGLLNKLNPEAQLAIDSQQIPLFKLKWKLESDNIKPGTIIHYLFNSLK